MAQNKIPSRPVAPEPPKLSRDIDMSVITPEKRLEIEKKARAKFEAQELLAAENKLLQDELDKLEKAQHPELTEEMRTIRIDVADFALGVTLDGKQFIHGELYEVRKSQYDVIMEVMQASKRHDAEVHGNQDSLFYRREKERYRVSMQTGMAQPGMRF